jgi:Recombination endonuclease VII
MENTDKTKPPCCVCGKPSKTRGMCAIHYDRWIRNGHTENTRPADWGTRRKHPLSEAWRHTIKCPQGRVERWNDMWPFVEDVGERPTPKHVLKRHNNSKPWGADNFYWRAPLARPDEDKLSKSEAAKRYRLLHPAKHKGYDLKKKYNITLDDYDRILEDQSGGCKICGEKDGTFGRLVVDHCHDKKHVRGLLCNKCNTGIGLFKDRTDLLESAIAYLKK